MHRAVQPIYHDLSKVQQGTGEDIETSEKEQEVDKGSSRKE